MSRIVFATLGSLGDLHPVLALASAMQGGGHAVVVATSACHEARVLRAGLRFHPLRPNLAPDDPLLVEKILDGAQGARTLIRDLIMPGVDAMHADLGPLVGAADLLVASELIYVAATVAEQAGVPWVSYALAPLSMLSAHDVSIAPVALGGPWLRRVPAPIMRLFFGLAAIATRGWWTPLRRLRRRLGLPPGPNPLFPSKFSPHLNLVLFSPVLQPPQPDWPSRSVACGFPFYDGDARLPEPVARFLAAGEPPVIFTLGSSAVHAAGEFYGESVRAAEKLHRRAFLLIGENPPPSGLSPDVFTWDYLPYAAVFPFGAAIVHQGGIGTTAQALRAGKPMLILPFGFDQPDNAARVARLGAGRVIDRRTYRAERVAAELRPLLENPAYASAARQLGARVQAENGIATAVAALNRLLGAGGSSIARKS